jgi:hypothetical protein
MWAFIISGISLVVCAVKRIKRNRRQCQRMNQNRRMVSNSPAVPCENDLRNMIAYHQAEINRLQGVIAHSERVMPAQVQWQNRPPQYQRQDAVEAE